MPSPTSILGRAVFWLALGCVAAAQTPLIRPALDLSESEFQFAANPGGPNPLPQKFKILNRGPGALQPTISVSADSPWLRVIRTGDSATINVDVTGLQEGAYSSSVTVRDDAAADSPRLVKVKLHVTRRVITEPERLDFILPPGRGGSRDVFLPVQSVPSGVLPGYQARTASGGNWLDLTLLPEAGLYLRTSVRSNLAEGSYTGSIEFDDRGRAAGSLPVSVTVTSKPILTLARTRLTVETSPGLEVPDDYVAVRNDGNGVLTWIAASDVPWMRASQQDGYLRISFAAAGLDPGTYRGNVAVSSAVAVNANVTLPVELTVSARGRPALKVEGAVDAANYCGRSWCYLAPGSLATLFGSQLSYTTVGATALPLSTTLGTTRVLVNGAPAELLYASYGQVNFRLPDALPPGGRWFIAVERDGQVGNVITARATTAAPAVFTANQSGLGQGAVLAAGTGQLADATHPVTRGGFLEIYLTGLGAGSGPRPTVLFFGPGVAGNIEVQATYAGPAPGFTGLNQINVQVPQGLAPGDRMRLQVRTAANLLSNVVEFAVR